MLAESAEAVFLGLDGRAGDRRRRYSPWTCPAWQRMTPCRCSAALAYARGLLHWARHQRYCGGCGATTGPRSGGHVRACLGADCGRLLFPRIEPAVIMLVDSATDPGRCLLARHRNSVLGSYSTLAGFVEVGESLEDAVRREVAEEVGLTVASRLAVSAGSTRSTEFCTSWLEETG